MTLDEKEAAYFRLHIAVRRLRIAIIRDAVAPWARPVVDGLGKLLAGKA